jgi:hypothetical protein
MSLADVMTRFTQALSYLAVILAIFNLPAWLLGDSDMPYSALLLLYLAPSIGSLLQLGLSRTREYDADLEGAELTGDPRGLAAALEKLERYQGHFWEDLMFPVPSRRIPQPSLLRSHPPTQQRIARLLALENRQMAPPIEVVEEPMVSLVGRSPGSMQPRYRFLAEVAALGEVARRYVFGSEAARGRCQHRGAVSRAVDHRVGEQRGGRLAADLELDALRRGRRAQRGRLQRKHRAGGLRVAEQRQHQAMAVDDAGGRRQQRARASQLRLQRQRPPELHALLEPVGEGARRLPAQVLDLQEVDDVLDPLPMGHLFLLREPPVDERREHARLHSRVATEH